MRPEFPSGVPGVLKLHTAKAGHTGRITVAHHSRITSVQAWIYLIRRVSESFQVIETLAYHRNPSTLQSEHLLSIRVTMSLSSPSPDEISFAGKGKSRWFHTEL